MVNKVVISAAGRGTRMKELTQDKPKHLLEINGQPFLYYLFKNLKGAGFSEFILVIGYKGEMIEDYVKKTDYPIRIVNQFEKFKEKYGTAIPILCAKDLVGDENFVAVSGSDLYSVGDLKAMRIDDNFHYVAGKRSDHPEDFGVLIQDNKGFLEKIVEKPKRYVGNLVNTSLYKFTPEIFDYAERVPISQKGEYYIVEALSELAKEKKVKVKEIYSYWLDFGRPEDIEELSKFFKEQNN